MFTPNHTREVYLSIRRTKAMRSARCGYSTYVWLICVTHTHTQIGMTLIIIIGERVKTTRNYKFSRQQNSLDSHKPAATGKKAHVAIHCTLNTVLERIDWQLILCTKHSSELAILSCHISAQNRQFLQSLSRPIYTKWALQFNIILYTCN